MSEFKPQPGPVAVRGRYCTDDEDGTAWVEVFVAGEDHPTVGCLPNHPDLAPWASAEEWAAIGRLVQLAREIVTLCPPGKWPSRDRAPIAALWEIHDLLEDAAPLIERMGLA